VIALAALSGVLAALGLLMIARELWPAPPRLDKALAWIQPTHLPVLRTDATDGGWREQVGARLVDHLSRPVGILAIPRTDLALLQRSAERFMLEKLTLFLAGLIAPGAAFSLLALVGASSPWMMPLLASLGAAAGLWFIPDAMVRSAARARRRDFRYAFTAYLQLVLLERDAGAALNTALENPATTAGGWAFARIHHALARARRAQQHPWRALADLGEQIGLPDLIDLAHTTEIAGGDGARMHDVLRAKIASMRHEAAATARAEANTRTTTMWVPTSVLMLGFVILIGFPFFARLLGST
jgi:Flp pilus assembly protein TadB